MIRLSEVSPSKTSRDITCMWNPKYGRKEPLRETESETQTQGTDLRLPPGHESQLALEIKNPPAHEGDIMRHGFDPWVGKIPWRRERLLTPASLPAIFHRQRSLVSYSPWGHKESDATEALTLSLFIVQMGCI